MPFVKARVCLYFEVENEAQVSEVDTTLVRGLDSAMRSYPGPGDYLEAEVESTVLMTAWEVEEAGYEE